MKEKTKILTQDVEESLGIAKRLFYFVRDEIKYNPYQFNLDLDEFRASRTLKRGEGYCVQKAVLLAALARAAGIPARLRFADIRNHLLPEKLSKLMQTNLFVYHGYNELHLEGKWIQATPTFDLQMCKENRIIPVEFDGRNHAKFHSHNLDGKLHIEYVQDHGHYEDLPLEEIVDATSKFYGDDAKLLKGRKRKLKFFTEKLI